MRDGDGGVEKLADVGQWRDSARFSEAERVALEYAERMTITGQSVDDALFARLREHYTDAQIVELTAAIALENFRSKFNPALRIEAQGFCLLPPPWANRQRVAPDCRDCRRDQPGTAARSVRYENVIIDPSSAIRPVSTLSFGWRWTSSRRNSASARRCVSFSA